MVHDTGATGATGGAEANGSRTAFPCNTCSLSFQSSTLQRSHMRGTWHIHNLQRKISGQPALSESEFADFENDNNGTSKRKKIRQTDSSPEPSHQDSRPGSSSSSSTHTSSSPDPQNSTPKPDLSTCLFCSHTSPTLSENLSHMSSTHSFFLPSPSSSSTSTAAIEPLLSYLSLLIHTYHECIYCAREKGSVKSVQSHMRDRGHCKVEGGLWGEFFASSSSSTEESEEAEEEDVQTSRRLEDVGKTRKKKKKSGKRVARQRSLQQREEEDGTTPPSSVEQALLAVSSSRSEISSGPLLPPTPAPPITGRNTELSLAGLSTAQLVSLASLDKKMRRQQVVAQKKVSQRALGQPVKAIYYKTENPVYQAG
ncbi:hypothetical protein COCVIDRAFT_84640 [Bipolaris victoriae FI3]|uniref:C2H2-type domain-containing protein n=1 Tax=Bipolaris victoriae (strain FI3) TaxID=930091 RepID=W7EWP2_BIPV3|nr:hypothetical protein COCVIDRAFT_84640 [Bipolaris victoriae FI3]